MFGIRHLGAVAGTAALLAIFSPSVRADDWDKKTIITFGQPVEVPGAVLQPGTYVMKLLNSSSNRHIVEIMNERQNHLYSMAFTAAAWRIEPTDRTVLTFYEAPAGQPRAVRTWFYPGDVNGQEFLYPKNHGQILAQNTSVAPAPTVATQATTTPEPIAQTPVAAPDVNEPAPVQQAAAEPAPAESKGEETLIAQAAPPPAANPEPIPAPPQIDQPAASADAKDESLPHTATNTFGLALLGLLSAGGAYTLRKRRAS